MGLAIAGLYFLWEGGYVTRLINPAEYWAMQVDKHERYVRLDQELVHDISVIITKRELTYDIDVQSRQQSAYADESPELGLAKAQLDINAEIQELHDDLNHWSQQFQADRETLLKMQAKAAEYNKASSDTDSLISE